MTIKADEQGRYVVVNTLLNTTDVTLVDQISGRLGDSGRLVYFAVKDGMQPHDLTGQDVFIRAKDAAGKIKQVTGISERIKPSAGLMSMYLPAEFYQASGPVEEAYLAITSTTDGSIVSSVPLTFNVLENNMIITANGSKDYIDQIDNFVEEMRGKVNDLSDALGTQNQSYVSLKKALDVYLDLINKNAVATLGSDNTFTGNNQFSQPITGTVTNAIRADNAATADVAKLAHKTDDDTGWMDISKNFLTGAAGTAKIRKRNGIVQLIIQAVTGYYESNKLNNGNQLLKLPWKGSAGASYPGEYAFVYNGAAGALSIIDDILIVHWVSNPSSDSSVHLYATITYIATD
ncbi:BppU family phage baseplate upper protein [Lactiplantibacillus plantarum]|uniref:BppU family phage baseplate upper protein n=1 Tax=Lactiplantibacillus plantarum TaxID=1590 RepID=UPI001BA6A766|nr:BppU family phage baseplate upper protein [Lactiplantibacillus plantarum]MBS0950717.1 hypothetical protein [Lactiplantibacillus plantarum]